MKVQKRPERVLIGFLGPVLSVPIGFLLNGVMQGLIGDSIAFFVLSIFFSLVMVGLQSIIYSMLMEYVVNPFIKNNYIAIFISMLMGFCSGYVLNNTMAFVGVFVGLLFGIILRVKYVQALKCEGEAEPVGKSFSSTFLLNLIKDKKRLYKYAAIIVVYMVAYFPIRELHLLVHYRTYQECMTPFSDDMDFCHTVTFPRMEISIFNFVIALPIRVLGFGLEVVYFPLMVTESTYWQYFETEGKQ